MHGIGMHKFGTLRHLVVALAVLTAPTVPSSPADAHRIQPIRFDLAPSGTGAQSTIFIENIRPYPVTLELAAKRIVLSDTGVETVVPADDDFLIFPPQVIVAPGKSQSVRVRYIGDPRIAKSVAYRINVDQLPIDMRGEGESAIAIVANFQTLVNVVPAGVRHQLSVTSVEPAPNGRWTVGIANAGARYARLSELNWSLTGGGRTQTYAPAATKAWFSSNLVLPGSTLRFTMPAQQGFEPQALAISVR